MPAFVRAAGDAAIVVAASTCVALAVNALRSDGLPLVTHEAYTVLVPCPEPVGTVEAISPAEVTWQGGTDLVVDARTAEEFAGWTAPGAENLAFDYLDPLPAQAVAALVARGSHRIVVFGDGAQPDSGREMARELAGSGVRNVFFIEGGAPALRAWFDEEAAR